jgi:FkbM family methyltransferase
MFYNKSCLWKTVRMYKLFRLPQQKKFQKSIPSGIRDAISEIHQGDIVVDLGANIGLATSIFQKLGATVYAVEPHPLAFASLQKRFKRNQSVVAINAAATIDSALTASLYLHEKSRLRPLYYSTGSSLMGEKPNVDSNSWIQVPSLNLVNFIRDLGKVKILKMDVEGYETILIPAILESGVVSQIDFIFIETHDRKWEGLANSSEEMKRHVAASPFRDKFYFDWP